MPHAHLISLTLMLLATLATCALALAIACAQGALESRIRPDAWVTITPAKREPWRPIKQPYSLATFRVLISHETRLEAWKAAFREAQERERVRTMAIRKQRTIEALERLKLNEQFDSLISDLDRRDSVRAIASMFQHRRFAS